MHALSDNGSGLRHALRERAVAALGTAAGTVAEPKAGAQQLKSALRWSRLALAGAAFAAGFLAGRRLRGGRRFLGD